MSVLIRLERPSDEAAIDALTLKAFAPMPFSNGTEAPIIRALRAAGDLTVSLVAEMDGHIVGHAAFSPVTVDGTHNGWFGLGPIAVEPDLQRAGVGRALIAQGLDMLRGRGAAGCALIGNPEIYARVGFQSDGQLTYRELDTGLVQRTVLAGPAPRGELRFAPAFEDAPPG